LVFTVLKPFVKENKAVALPIQCFILSRVYRKTGTGCLKTVQLKALCNRGGQPIYTFPYVRETAGNVDVFSSVKSSAYVFKLVCVFMTQVGTIMNLISAPLIRTVLAAAVPTRGDFCKSCFFEFLYWACPHISSAGK
jgi:hypothetical protein